MEQRPPVTLALLAVNVLLYFQPEALGGVVPPIRDACLQPYQIVQGLQFSRLLWSAFLHADEMHLFYNMSSLLWKGCQLEPDLGSLSFLALVGELLALSHVATVGLAAAAAKMLPDLAGDQYYSSCAIGFSAVLFALKVVLSYRTPGWSHVAGFELPTKYVCWAELAYIQLLTPQASFLGHLGGILAGLLHVHVFERLTLSGAGALPGFRGWNMFRWQRPAAYTGTARYATENGEAGSAADDVREHWTRRQAGQQDGRRLGRSSMRDQQQDVRSSADSRQSNASLRRGSEQDPFTDRSRQQRRPMWKRVFRWERGVLLVALLAIAVATTPDEQHFVKFVQEYTQRGLGFLPGFAASSLLWLQMKGGSGPVFWNARAFSIARYQGFTFLGILNTWIPLPVRFFSSWGARWWGQASSMLGDGDVRWPLPLEVLVAVNLVVFLGWLLGSTRWMVKYFEVSARNFVRRPWTLLTASVSHADLYSLIGNFQMLFMVGPYLQAELGWKMFTGLYFVSGVAANVADYIGNVLVRRRRLWSTKGASAAVYALLACTALMQPYRKFVWLFGIELNSLGLLGAKLLYEYVAKSLGGGPVPELLARIVGAGTGFVFASILLDCNFLDCLPKTIVPWNSRVIASSALR
ncbi:g7292 [Coccomyxa viridis]|uniref:G7292 protein n=1 Tax=Coccomyxa viridis TaxID=1274662 RepID=A0ABP1FXH0_9CHLO